MSAICPDTRQIATPALGRAGSYDSGAAGQWGRVKASGGVGQSAVRVDLVHEAEDGEILGRGGAVFVDVYDVVGAVAAIVGEGELGGVSRGARRSRLDEGDAGREAV